jgi:hypothetical protein
MGYSGLKKRSYKFKYILGRSEEQSFMRNLVIISIIIQCSTGVAWHTVLDSAKPYRSPLHSLRVVVCVDRGEPEHITCINFCWVSCSLTIEEVSVKSNFLYRRKKTEPLTLSHEPSLIHQHRHRHQHRHIAKSILS